MSKSDPKRLFEAKTGNGTATLLPRCETDALTLVASNFTSNAVDISECQFITFNISSMKKGIAAVHLITQVSNDLFNGVSYFIEIDSSTTAPINLNDFWLPSADRLGWVDSRGVYVKMDGTIYTSNTEKASILGYQYIPGDLICQFLYHDISLVDMLKIASTTNPLEELEKNFTTLSTSFNQLKQTQSALQLEWDKREKQLLDQLETVNLGATFAREVNTELTISLQKALRHFLLLEKFLNSSWIWIFWKTKNTLEWKIKAAKSCFPSDIKPWPEDKI